MTSCCIQRALINQKHRGKTPNSLKTAEILVALAASLPAHQGNSAYAPSRNRGHCQRGDRGTTYTPSKPFNPLRIVPLLKRVLSVAQQAKEAHAACGAAAQIKTLAGRLKQHTQQDCFYVQSKSSPSTRFLYRSAICNRNRAARSASCACCCLMV